MLRTAVKAESPAVWCRPAHSCPRTCATARPRLAHRDNCVAARLGRYGLKLPGDRKDQ
jgi:hypothetical protein